MTDTFHLRRWELALLMALCVSMLWGLFAAKEQRSLAEGLIRLHVIAESDSEKDQAAKLLVRDAVLEALTPELESAETPQAAAETIRALLPELEAVSAETGGCAARASLGWETYPTREYGEFALPAGEYLSLRIELGEAKGHNWWCVVYPPLCTTAAGSAEAVSALLSGRNAALITEDGGGYVLKFRCMELWAAFHSRFTGK